MWAVGFSISLVLVSIALTKLKYQFFRKSRDDWMLILNMKKQFFLSFRLTMCFMQGVETKAKWSSHLFQMQTKKGYTAQ